MKNFIKIVSLLWLGVWLYYAVIIFIFTPLQIANDKEFSETQIKPSVNFVKKFKVTNGRLPNNREYYTWQREFHKDYSSDLTQKVDSLIPGLGKINYIRNLQNVDVNDYKKFENANWNTDFAIGVWRGEWTEYYFSWAEDYHTNDYNWLTSFLVFLGMIGIGVFPLILASRKKSLD